jgi:hypothetical protein
LPSLDFLAVGFVANPALLAYRFQCKLRNLSCALPPFLSL